MDEHGVTDAGPSSRPLVSDSRANPPHDESGGCDDKYGQDMNGKKVVPPRHLENSSVNVIHSRRLRIHRCVVDRSTVQDIVCDRPVITLIANEHRRQERGRTQDDDKRDDDDSRPNGFELESYVTTLLNGRWVFLDEFDRFPQCSGQIAKWPKASPLSFIHAPD